MSKLVGIAAMSDFGVEQHGMGEVFYIILHAYDFDNLTEREAFRQECYKLGCAYGQNFKFIPVAIQGEFKGAWCCGRGGSTTKITRGEALTYLSLDTVLDTQINLNAELDNLGRELTRREVREYLDKQKRKTVVAWCERSNKVGKNYYVKQIFTVNFENIKDKVNYLFFHNINEVPENTWGKKNVLILVQGSSLDNRHKVFKNCSFAPGEFVSIGDVFRRAIQVDGCSWGEKEKKAFMKYNEVTEWIVQSAANKLDENDRVNNK